MNNAKRANSTIMAALRAAYSSKLLLNSIFNLRLKGGDDVPRVFYGGARSGNLGGPLVKVQRLKQFYPEYKWNYNLVYCLSNAPYLPDAALDILRIRGIPIVHNQNGLFYRAWYEGDWMRQNARMARTYHQARHVFWQSEFCRRSADKLLGSRIGSGEVLYNAVDTEHFRPIGRIPNAKTTLLLTGKIDDHMYYRVDSTLRGLATAVNHGFDGVLNIAGWIAPLVRSRSDTLAAELGIVQRVKYLGPYTQNDAPRIYSDADIYIMTKHNDPCPNAVLEAMACGLPVVHSISGGVPELVANTGAGVIVPEDFERIHVPAPNALSDAIMFAAANQGELSVQARRRAVECFDISKWINRHSELFISLLK
ncbi:MAG: glycosyltransferase family 4 protein [Beijerinckiaceae bacterium]|nr:glycosyltransferase family 4 protein [Beijerinckiaceae bacterium]